MDSIPELRLLISEIDGVFAECGNAPLEATALRSKLTMWSRALLDSLPDFMQSALLLSRGSDTHFQVSLVYALLLLQPSALHCFTYHLSFINLTLPPSLPLSPSHIIPPSLSLLSQLFFQVSQAETERLLAHFVDIELAYRKKKGTYTGESQYLQGILTLRSIPRHIQLHYLVITFLMFDL